MCQCLYGLFSHTLHFPDDPLTEADASVSSSGNTTPSSDMPSLEDTAIAAVALQDDQDNHAGRIGWAVRQQGVHGTYIDHQLAPDHLGGAGGGNQNVRTWSQSVELSNSKF